MFYYYYYYYVLCYFRCLLLMHRFRCQWISGWLNLRTFLLHGFGSSTDRGHDPTGRLSRDHSSEQPWQTVCNRPWSCQRVNNSISSSKIFLSVLVWAEIRTPILPTCPHEIRIVAYASLCIWDLLRTHFGPN